MSLIQDLTGGSAKDLPHNMVGAVAKLYLPTTYMPSKTLQRRVEDSNLNL